MFYYWGRFVTRQPKVVIAAALLLLFTALPFIPAGISKLSPDGWVPDDAETLRASELIDERFSIAGPTLLLILENPNDAITGAEALEQLRATVEPVRQHPDVARVTDYASTPSDALISTDRQKSVVFVELNPETNGESVLSDLRALTSDSELTVYWGGGIAANQTFNDTVKRDLLIQEAVALPLTLVLLVVIFGTIVAASLPLTVGLVAIGTSIGGIAILAILTDTSVYVLHVATMIGLALAIDYSLFIVSRFREEIAKRPVDEAVAVTMGTAGKAVFFAGLTVAIGLIGLAFFPMYALRTMGIGGGIVVVMAVVFALTVLPATLFLLGHRIDRGRVRNVTPMPASSSGFWHWLAFFVMRRPLIILVTVLLLLIAVGSPFLRANFAPPGVDLLPSNSEPRVAFDILLNEFPQQQSSAPIVVVIDTNGQPVTDPATFAEIRQVYDTLAARPDVRGVESVFDFMPGGADATIEEIFTTLQTSDQMTQAQISRFIADDGARLNVRSVALPSTPEAESLVRDIRGLNSETLSSIDILVSGETAFNIDMMDGIRSTLPYTLGFIFVVTYVVLFLLLGSVFLPFKAILVNLLSITAAFGALIWIFQEGNLSGLLAFDATGYIVPTIAIIMFCVLFGLSMDYEVMMLSRMKEEYERSGNNTTAVAIGLERTGRVITGAALIMIVLFGAGVTNQLVMLKSLGVGMAIAIFVDATIARGLLVPSTMRLMGWVNWWAPASLKRFQERIGMGEVALELDRQREQPAQSPLAHDEPPDELLWRPQSVPRGDDQVEAPARRDYLRIALATLSVIVVIGLIGYFVFVLLGDPDDEEHGDDPDLASVPTIINETPTPEVEIAEDEPEPSPVPTPPQEPAATPTPEPAESEPDADDDGEQEQPDPAATPAPEPEDDGVETPPGQLGPGATVVVANTLGIGVNVRAAPSAASEIQVSLPDGAQLTITGEPVEAEGWVWWPVETESGTGYVVENFIQPVE